MSHPVNLSELSDAANELARFPAVIAAFLMSLADDTYRKVTLPPARIGQAVWTNSDSDLRLTGGW